MINDYPMSSMQDMNLDWIIKKVKELAQDWASKNENWDKWQKDTNVAFADLKNYVMNYFVNLDVQDEINNKLDEMIKDGTIMSLFTSDLVPYVMPEWYGAKGDGINDDTEAIIQAIKNGNIVTFTKKYLVKNEITIDKEITFNGGGEIHANEKRMNIFTFNKKAIVNNLSFYGLGEGFEGESEGSGTLILIKGDYSKISNCKFKDADYVGLQCYKTNYITILDCDYLNCWAEGLSFISSNSTITSCNFINCSYNGLVLRGSENVYVNNCNFLNCANTDVALDILPNYDKTKYGNNIVINNCTFSNNYISISADGESELKSFKNIKILNSNFIPRNTTEIEIRLIYASSIISGCTFNGEDITYAILCDPCIDSIITNSVFYNNSYGIDSSSVKTNICSNIFYNCKTRIRVWKNEYVNQAIISNNIFNDGDYGIETLGDYWKNISILNNTFINMQENLKLNGSTDQLSIIGNVFNVLKIDTSNIVKNQYIQANNNNIDKKTCDTSSRPTTPYNGMYCFDTSLNKPIFYNNKWVDSTGADI